MIVAGLSHKDVEKNVLQNSHRIDFHFMTKMLGFHRKMSSILRLTIDCSLIPFKIGTYSSRQVLLQQCILSI